MTLPTIEDDKRVLDVCAQIDEATKCDSINMVPMVIRQCGGISAVVDELSRYVHATRVLRRALEIVEKQVYEAGSMDYYIDEAERELALP